MYTSILAIFTLVLPKRLRRLAKSHLVFLLLTAWVVYVYRDLWPLATFTLQPLDPAIWTTYATLILLTLVTVIVPLFMPHEYVPVDPLKPYKEINAEQTASWFDFLCFTFLDPIVWKASHVEHLDLDSLPPLADYDATKYLCKRSFPKLDPMLLPRHRHLFFGLLSYFYKEFLLLALLIAIKVVVGFAGPLGINRLLTYIETGGQGAVVRPWVWISWLFLGPFVGSVAMQWYIFVNTRTLVRIEGIITQLVFEHALRIRMKEETGSGKKEDEGPTIVGTPAQEGEVLNGEGNISNGETIGPTPLSSSNTSALPKGKQKDHSISPSITPSTTSTTAAAKKDAKQENLVGKINNFISTDLGNITDARDLLFMVWYCPLQIAICVWFLYSILGVA